MRYEISQINDLSNEIRDFIRVGDDNYFNQVYEITQAIYESRVEKPIILLAGPSGSGKTTTALNIEKILDERSCGTHTLSLDNYFKPLNNEEKALLAAGKLDLESPERIDTEFLNQQLQDIIECKPIELYKYDFKKAQRKATGKVLNRQCGDLVILEGTHSLNPDLLSIDDNATIKLYASIASSIKNNDYELTRADIRLLRRMLRDRNFRGRSEAETLMMSDNVEAGEIKYIKPYMHRADYEIDTFILYEVNVYCCLIDQLKKLNSIRVDNILKIMQQLKKIDEKYVPASALIREFIGNGNFEY